MTPRAARRPAGRRGAPQTRVHLLTVANPLRPDVRRLGLRDVDGYLALIRKHLPAPLRLTFSRALLTVEEDAQRGGRRDDVARARDLQQALADPRTLAIVASNGGGYLSRVLPRVDFGVLARRRTPVAVVGFSEITSVVNLASTYARGRGVYWLCPNYLGWKIRPVSEARAAFARFWQELPARLSDWLKPPGRAGVVRALSASAGGTAAGAPPGNLLSGRLVSGRASSGPVRLVGGCLSVLAALLTGAPGVRIRPDGRWLILEDVGEAPHRIDRHLAALRFAGWFERAVGVILGDFHMQGARDQRSAVVELLRFHAPPGLPVVTTRDFGHVWPMSPLPLNRWLAMHVSRDRVQVCDIV